MTDAALFDLEISTKSDSGCLNDPSSSSQRHPPSAPKFSRIRPSRPISLRAAHNESTSAQDAAAAAAAATICGAAAHVADKDNGSSVAHWCPASRPQSEESQALCFSAVLADDHRIPTTTTSSSALPLSKQNPEQQQQPTVFSGAGPPPHKNLPLEHLIVTPTVRETNARGDIFRSRCRDKRSGRARRLWRTRGCRRRERGIWTHVNIARGS